MPASRVQLLIDPALCTECVGFHGREACAAVCPVDCCIPDANIVETEAVLYARAKTLHPAQTLPAFEALTADLSRFRQTA